MLNFMYATPLDASHDTVMWLPDTAMNGFLRKESMIGMLLDCGFNFTPSELKYIDSELGSSWERSIETHLLHVNIKSYHHLVWRARLQTQRIPGARLYRLMHNMSQDESRSQINQATKYDVYTMNSRAEAVPFTVRNSTDNWFKVKGTRGSLSGYYNMDAAGMNDETTA